MFVNFDMSQFDSYREDNRREVKKAKGEMCIRDRYAAERTDKFFG